MASPLSPGRAFLTGAAMAVAGGEVARAAFSAYWTHLGLAAFGALIAVAGIGLTRRSLSVAVLSRGIAGLVFAVTGTTAVAMAGHGHLPLEFALVASTTGGALLLSRPVLHTKEAREAFAPYAFRRILLTGSIVTAAAGFAVVLRMLLGLESGATGYIALSVLAAAYFASAVGVVRMRAWGVLLGALTSVGLLAIAPFVDGGAHLASLAVAAAVPLVSHLLPVLVARWRSVEKAGSEEARVRIGSVADAREALDEDLAEESAKKIAHVEC